MKEAILIILHSIFLLAVRGSTYQCPDCIIPCVANSIPNITNSYLLQTFYHQIRDHTLLTFLDAINGDVRFMSSNGREVFTKTISIATNGYTMSELCSIFSNAPRLLRTSPYPKIKFRYFPTYLLSDVDESGNFYLFEKMSLLLVEQRDVIVQLRDVKSDFDILNYTLRDNVDGFRIIQITGQSRFNPRGFTYCTWMKLIINASFNHYREMHVNNIIFYYQQYTSGLHSCPGPMFLSNPADSTLS